MTSLENDHGTPPAPTGADADGCCPEGSLLAAASTEVTRRGVLKGLGATGLGVTTAMFGGTALSAVSSPAHAAPGLVPAAAAGSTDDVVVVVSLSGGADMLSLVVPHADPAYAAARPTIAVPTGALWGRDAMFGLHPALKPLQPWWDSRQMGVVTATGLPVPNRSHFAALEEIEDADPGDAVRAGWLNRALGLSGADLPQQGVHLGSGMLPTSLAGSAATLAVGELDATALNGPQGIHRRRRAAALNRMWGGTPGHLGHSARKALRVASDLKPVTGTSYRPANGARYPSDDLGDALKDAARLIRSGTGVRAVTVDHGSWDMHARLGRVDDKGERNLSTLASGLSRALAAFLTDLGPLVGSRVTVVTVSEFGRRVEENGSRGLDHGWGSAMLVVGAGVRGRRYLGRWPGLGRQQRVDGDLAVTTDYRSVLAEVLSHRFDVSAASVFPGFRAEPVGIVTS